jgi:hypothetical protein
MSCGFLEECEIWEFHMLLFGCPIGILEGRETIMPWTLKNFNMRLEQWKFPIVIHRFL